MAGLINTYLQDIRIAHPNMLDRQEWRNTRYGLVNAAIEMTNSPFGIFSDEVKRQALASEGRVIDIPVVKKGNLTVLNTRTCAIGDYENESDMVNLTWTTLTVDVSMIPAQYHKNEVDYTNDFALKMVQVKEAILGQMETSLDTLLDANKSTVYNSTLVGLGSKYGALVGDAIQVPLADQQFFFNDLGAIQNSDEFYQDHLIIGSTNLLPPVSQYINQGSANSTNTEFMFNDKEFRFSNNVTNGAGVNSTGYAMPAGTVGLLTRNSIDARMGHTSTDGTEWGEVNIDGLPFKIGYTYKSACADSSAVNGSGLEHLTASKKENYQFHVDFAVATPYNSDPVTKAGGIKKFEFLNS